MIVPESDLFLILCGTKEEYILVPNNNKSIRTKELLPLGLQHAIYSTVEVSTEHFIIKGNFLCKLMIFPSFDKDYIYVNLL